MNAEMQLTANLSASQLRQNVMTLEACLQDHSKLQELLAKTMYAKYTACLKCGFSEEQSFILCRS